MTTGTDMRAAGLMMVDDTGRVLLCKRADTGEWAFPGGRIEDGETARQAAVREAEEETGVKCTGAGREVSRRIKDGVDFTTFIHDAGEAFDPILCDEHTEHMWAAPDDLPEPMHPGVHVALSLYGATELDAARAIASGELASPHRFANVSLFAVRITGTGAAYRSKGNEYVWRDPSLYLNDEFLARCNGLAVIFEHPEAATLDSDEFGERIIGSILLPYIKGDEVWGVAKIYDDAAISLMTSQQLSTSPAVVFRDADTNSSVELEDGAKLLIEGKPSLLDHLAICAQGVWDKGASPSGVLSENIGDQIMADDNSEAEDKKADEAACEDKKADADPLKAIADSISALASRMDAYESKKADSDDGDKDEDDKKADADEDGKAEEMAADAKKDSDEDEKKADATVKADADLVARLAALDKRIPKILSDAELNDIADTQSRADSVCAGFGETAPRPIQGESPRAYRVRVASKLKVHSEAWKGVDLARADDAILDIAEKAIYADARAVADQPATVPEGQLREVIRADDTGRRIKTYIGDPDTWMSDFKSPRKRVSKFITRQEA